MIPGIRLVELLIYLLLLKTLRGETQAENLRVTNQRAMGGWGGGGGFRSQGAHVEYSSGDDGLNPPGMFFCGVTQSSFPGLLAVSGVRIVESEEERAFLRPGRNAARSVTAQKLYTY